VHTGCGIIRFNPPIVEISGLYVSYSGVFLVISGKDYQGRDVVLVYNFPDLVKYGKIELITRQLSDFTIFTLAKNPINDSVFVTGGNNSVRFWKIKIGKEPTPNVATATSVMLNKIGRDKEFTFALFDYEEFDEKSEIIRRLPKGKKRPTGRIHWVYLTTSCGLLFQIDYNTKVIEQAIQIHND
jgi:hypothetical protein